ncbi:hypothetical protein Pfo_015369 [Paulownia fortunei]|nr:hypothetical protein Pfo_015369 [Paulownia fortunei]
MSSHEEPKLSIQSFYQCSSLISIKISTTNFLHHISDPKRPVDDISDSAGKKIKNPNLDPWITNDGLLMSWLLGNMKEEVLNMIFGGDTVYSIWKSLQEQLLPDIEENEAQLKNNLYALSKGILSLDEYIRKFKEIYDKLVTIGKLLGDVDKVFQVSQGLGDKYKEFQIVVLSKPPYPSFNQFIMSVQNYEQVYLREENQAFFRQRGRGRDHRGGRGNFRGKGQPNKQNTNQVACQIYGRTNHTAVKYYYRYNYETEGENVQEAFTTMNLNNENDPKFYDDSRATAHMTNQGGNLKALKSYFGTNSIFVGNGQALSIIHIGKALLNSSHGKVLLNNVLVVPKIKKNLLSINKLVDDNFCTITFDSNKFVIKDQKNQILVKGHREGDLYALEGGQFT